MNDEKLKIISDELSKETKNSKPKRNTHNYSAFPIKNSNKFFFPKQNKLVSSNIISDDPNIKNQDQDKNYLPLKNIEFHPPISAIYNQIMTKKKFNRLKNKVKTSRGNTNFLQPIIKFRRNISCSNIKKYSPKKDKNKNKTCDNMSKTFTNKKCNITHVKFNSTAYLSYRSNKDLKDTHYNIFSLYHNKTSNNNNNKRFNHIETNPLNIFASDFFKNEIKENQTILAERLPLNYLWQYRSQLFNKKDYKYKKNKNCSEDQKDIDTRPEDIEILYETIDFCGKKSCVATKLINNKYKLHNNSSAKSVLNHEENTEDDYHYLMKHPFLSSNYNNSKQGCVNSYINNNLNEEYGGKFNPLLDEDLIDKIHHLIINPNTLQIRNEKLINIYKNFVRGPLKTKYNRKYVDEKNIEQEKMIRFRAFLKQLDETLLEAKRMNQKCENIVEDNKIKLNNKNDDV